MSLSVIMCAWSETAASQSGGALTAKWTQEKGK